MPFSVHSVAGPLGIQQAPSDPQFHLHKKATSMGQVKGPGPGKCAYSVSWKEKTLRLLKARFHILEIYLALAWLKKRRSVRETGVG